MKIKKYIYCAEKESIFFNEEERGNFKKTHSIRTRSILLIQKSRDIDVPASALVAQYFIVCNDRPQFKNSSPDR